jgi:hypothetical protein
VADFGWVTCDLIRGSPQQEGDRVETWVVPGQNGVGVQILGKGDGGFEMRAIRFATAANVKTWFTSLKALQGTIVTITGWVWTLSNVLVEQVGMVEITPAYIPPSSDWVRGECVIRCYQRT